jgi:hypothetical protein
LVFCDVRDAPKILAYNIPANLVMTLWAEDIGLDSEPDRLEMARRSYRAIPNKEHSSKPHYLRQLQLLLAILDRPSLSAQGRVLSWPGRIHLYAGVPEGHSVNDAFAGHLAIGGFEVAARHVGAEVRGVRIKSLAGNTCRVKSPWEQAEAKVIELPSRCSVEHRMEGDTIIFDTESDHTYALLAGSELTLAEKRYAPDEIAVGRWRFDGETDGAVADQSADGHDARLMDGAELRETDDGAGLSLNGRGAHARVERTSAFDFSADQGFSVEARIRVPAGPPGPVIPVVCSMDQKQYCLLLDGGLAVFYLSSPNGDTSCRVAGTSALTDGRWHVVRGARDVSDHTVRVYVDGRLETSVPDTTSGDFASGAPIAVGAYLWGEHTRYAEGLIDYLEIKTLGRLVDR